jgi:hypothetical protein
LIAVLVRIDRDDVLSLYSVWQAALDPGLFKSTSKTVGITCLLPCVYNLPIHVVGRLNVGLCFELETGSLGKRRTIRYAVVKEVIERDTWRVRVTRDRLGDTLVVDERAQRLREFLSSAAKAVVCTHV